MYKKGAFEGKENKEKKRKKKENDTITCVLKRMNFYETMAQLTYRPC